MVGPGGLIGKFLIFTGLLLIVIGALFYLFSRIPGWGRLPGDILIQRKNFTFYFPLTTSILISIFLSLLLTLIFRR